MKKLILIIFIGTYSFCGGMVVTDLASYGYYAQQIKAFNDQVNNAVQSLEVLNEANDLVNTTNDLLTNSGEKIFNPTKKILGIVNNLQNTADRFQSMSERVKDMGIERFMKDYHNSSEPLNDKAFKRWKDNFEALFDNSKDETYIKLNQRVDDALIAKNYKDYTFAMADLRNYLKLKEIEKDSVKRYSLLSTTDYYNDYYLNEESVNNRKAKKEHVSKLIKQIDSADDLHKQTQTTNQILIEVLEIAQAQYELQMMFFNSVSVNQLSQASNAAHDMEKIHNTITKFDEKKESIDFSTRENGLENLIKKGENNAISRRLKGELQ